MSSWPAFPNRPKRAQLFVRPDVQIAEDALVEARLSHDVCTLSDFRANVAAKIARVRSTSQPMVITQHGRGSAVLFGIETFENLVREVELLRDVRAAEDELAASQGSEQAGVETRLRGLLGR
jgi:antitoxin YefM